MLKLETLGRLRRLALAAVGAAVLSLAPGAALAAICGDGLTVPPEACDDGNTVGGDGCSAFCTIEDCGNNVLDVGETCDPGTGTCGGSTAVACSGTPTCDDDCTPAACGDGNVNASVPEDCESGGVDTAGCDGDPAGTPAAQNCTFAGCGDGRLNTANNEACDDGNGTSGDGCDANCTVTACGNGITTAGEVCDDGNAVNGDSCDNNCTPTGCGNGILTAPEECDDGNNISGDGCGAGCGIELCGNGNLQPANGEECDPGPVPTATCDGLCQDIACGNGTTETTEQCDPGTGTTGNILLAAAHGATCDNDCTPAVCGDMVTNTVGAGEACDDGPGGTCDDVTCQFVQCGDGILNSNEACDPGTGAGGDAFTAAAHGATCDADCTPAVCGDSTLNSVGAGEECDPPDLVSCDANCLAISCPNGRQESTEACDDGNGTDGDGCDTNCTISGCGNGITAGGEACDDGNLASGDGCDSNCTVTACGNGVQTAGEECDDSNIASFDGCDFACRDEVCGNGILGTAPGSPVQECDDGNAVSSDGCTAACKIDIDSDGLLASDDDACTPSSYTVPAASPPDQNPSKARLTLNGLDNVGDHDVIVKGRFNPARPLVCEDNLTPCLIDAMCSGIGAGTCGLPTPSRSGVHVKLTQGSPPLSGTVYDQNVPGDNQAPGGEYFKNSPTPACGSTQDGWKVVNGNNGRAVYIYKNKSGVVPAPADSIDGVCTAAANGISLLRLSFNPTKGEWKYLARVKNSTLAMTPAVIGGAVQGPMQAQVALGVATPYVAGEGLQGENGQCADAQYRGPGPGGVGGVGGCKATEKNGTLFRVSCK